MQSRKQLDILRKSSKTKIGILVGLPLLASLGGISLHCYRVHNFCFYHLFALIVNDDVPMKIEHNSREPLAFCSIQSAKWDDDRRVYGGITNKGGWREPKIFPTKVRIFFRPTSHTKVLPCCIAAHIWPHIIKVYNWLILCQKKTDISPNKARKIWNRLLITLLLITQRSVSCGNVLRRKQLEKWHQLPGKEGSG